MEAETFILLVSFLLGCRLAGSAVLCPRPQLQLLSITTSIQILVTSFSSYLFKPRRGPKTTLRFDDLLDERRELTESCYAFFF